MASLATMAIFTICRSTPFKMRVLKEKGMEEAQLKKKGSLGVRLVEGLRLPALHIVRQISGDELAADEGADLIAKHLTESLRPAAGGERTVSGRGSRTRASEQAVWRGDVHVHSLSTDLVEFVARSCFRNQVARADPCGKKT